MVLYFTYESTLQRWGFPKRMYAVLPINDDDQRVCKTLKKKDSSQK